MRRPTRDASGALEIPDIKISMATSTFLLVGTTPLIMHRMSAKAQHELLLPSPKKNTAERAQTLKHEPLQEYRDSLYRSRAGNDKETVLHLPTPAFKRALADAALEVPGAAKAQIGRLTSIASAHVAVWGVPQIYMAMVRQSGPARTPDVRTRGILPQWGCAVSVQYLKGSITEANVAGLLGMAGVVIGVGDYRPQKGAGNFGQFRLADSTDKEWLALKKNGGRAAQLKAIESPESYDVETEDLLQWFDEELVRRERAPAKLRRVV